MGRSYRGMVLAAGLGTRLSPLTDVIPKPLVPLGGERLVESAIRRLVTGGISEIAVNLHHLAEQIPAVLGNGSQLGCHLGYFHEPTLLGTGGALRNAAAFLAGGPFVVTNSDVVTDLELEPLLRHHEQSGALITLQLQPRDSTPHSSVLLDAGNRIVDVGGMLGAPGTGLRDTQFTGTAVYEPQVLDLLPSGVSQSPRDLWIPLLRKHGPAILSGWCSEGYFSDVGTWDRLFQTHRERLRPQHSNLPPSVRVEGPVYIHETAQVDPRVELGPGVTLGRDVVVVGQTALSDIIVLPGERVGPGTYKRGVVCHGLFLQPSQER